MPTINIQIDFSTTKTSASERTISRYWFLNKILGETIYTSRRNLTLVTFFQKKTLECLEEIDLRLNKLGKRWEEKFNETGNFPKLNQIKTI